MRTVGLYVVPSRPHCKHPSSPFPQALLRSSGSLNSGGRGGLPAACRSALRSTDATAGFAASFALAERARVGTPRSMSSGAGVPPANVGVPASRMRDCAPTLASADDRWLSLDPVFQVT